MFQSNDQAVGLEADHLQICKFADAKNTNAKRVLQTFEAVITLVKAQLETRGSVQRVPSPSHTKEEALGDNARLQQRLQKLRN
jgi:hypothetical protein